MVALPFCHRTLTAAKPRDARYPREIVSMGDHIRARRIELCLLQKQAAADIGVTVSALLNWEKNRSKPSLRFVPKIIEFLGYDLQVENRVQLESMVERLKAQRMRLGLSRKKLARFLKIDESNLAGWERGEHRPTKKSLAAINAFLSWLTPKT